MATRTDKSAFTHISQQSVSHHSQPIERHNQGHVEVISILQPASVLCRLRQTTQNQKYSWTQVTYRL